MQSPFVKAFVCNVLYSCNGTTITVNKLQNEMHSIDTIRLLNCCSFYSWQSTSQIKLFSQIGHTHTHHSESQHAKISVATELVYPHWDQRKTFQLTAFSTPHMKKEHVKGSLFHSLHFECIATVIHILTCQKFELRVTTTNKATTKTTATTTAREKLLLSCFEWKCISFHFVSFHFCMYT